MLPDFSYGLELVILIGFEAIFSEILRYKQTDRQTHTMLLYYKDDDIANSANNYATGKKNNCTFIKDNNIHKSETLKQ